MGADPIGALPAGQGNVERARAMNPILHWSDEAMDWPSIFIPPLHVATAELEWASIVLVQVRVILAASRRCGPRNRTANLPHGGVGKSRHASLVGLVDRARGIRRQCYGMRNLGLAQGRRACTNRNKLHAA